jgi:hypothetical protein
MPKVIRDVATTVAASMSTRSRIWRGSASSDCLGGVQQRAAAFRFAGQLAVYLTALEPGDTVLGLDLAHGGHLTHGMRLNISGRLYNFVSYGVTRDTHRIDFDQVARLAREHKPKMIVAGRVPIRGRFSMRGLRRSPPRWGEAVRGHGPLCRPGRGGPAR